ncbi:MAG: hypothetical protein M3285_03520 [Actinomycetota bacterium]|nr:hypothetical protein [Actinomycetota bacterium]
MSDANSEAIVKALVDHGVDFVVIGASAAILQGVPIAATLDLDVTAGTSTPNLKRLAAALKEMDARLRVPYPEESVAVELDARMLAGLSVATLMTRHGPFDLLFAPAGSSSYADLKSRAVEVAPFRLPFRVASIEDLISMKRAAGREKDAAHLTILLDHLRSESHGS